MGCPVQGLSGDQLDSVKVMKALQNSLTICSIERLPSGQTMLNFCCIIDEHDRSASELMRFAKSQQP